MAATSLMQLHITRRNEPERTKNGITSSLFRSVAWVSNFHQLFKTLVLFRMEIMLAVLASPLKADEAVELNNEQTVLECCHTIIETNLSFKNNTYYDYWSNGQKWTFEPRKTTFCIINFV